MTDYRKYINALRECAKEYEGNSTSTDHHQDMSLPFVVSDLCRDTANLLESLEQESCEDCISRQSVLNALCNDCELYKNEKQTCFSKCEEYHFLVTLPSVKPKEKVGHWNTYIVSCDGIDEEWLECSECMWSNALLIPRNYCPNCGCRMEGSE